MLKQTDRARIARNLLFGLCILVGMSAAGQAATITIDFEGVDTSGGPVSGGTLDTYLAGFGVTLANIVAPTNTVVADRDGVLSVYAASGVNFLDQQTGGATSRSYDVVFGSTLDSFAFTRTAYFGATGSGLIYPAWSATAYDSGGGILASVGEAKTGTFNTPGSPVPAKVFLLNTPGIAKVRFFGDHEGNAGRAAAAVDDFVLETSTPAVPEPSTLVLFGLGMVGLGGYHLRRKRK